MKTLQEVENDLLGFVCVCGRPHWDHDFSGGGNSETGCEGFTAADTEGFAEVLQEFDKKLLETSRDFPRD